MRIVSYLLVIFLLSCSKNEDSDSGTYARVGPVELKKGDREAGDIEKWVDTTILLLAAKNKGLEKDLELVRKRDNYYNQLLVSSFVESEVSRRIEISNKDTRSYYEKNKDQFMRSQDEARIEQYFMIDKKEARRLVSIFKSQKNPNLESVSIERVLSDIVKRGVFSKNIDNEIFLRNKRTVGPVLLGGEICVLRVLNIYKKGSHRGLEEVFDEVYQRIYKAQVSKNRLFLLDSLKKTMNIFINPEYQ